MTTQKHTPTPTYLPWTKKYEQGLGCYIINDAGSCIADLLTEEEADAIISGVNSHDALVEALKEFAEIGQDLTHLLCHNGIVPVDMCCRCHKVLAAREALRAAGVEI